MSMITTTITITSIIIIIIKRQNLLGFQNLEGLFIIMNEENPNITNAWAYSFAARMVSLWLAIGLTVLVLAYPKAFAPSGIHSVRHDLLSLMMLGIAAGFVHGVGFVPQHLGWRMLWSPYLAWTLMLGGLVWIGALLV